MSDSNWSQLIGVLQLLGTGFLAVLMARTQSKVHQVQTAVDGPLSDLTKKYAEVTMRIFKITGLDDDRATAIDAAAINKMREEGKAAQVGKI